MLWVIEGGVGGLCEDAFSVHSGAPGRQASTFGVICRSSSTVTILRPPTYSSPPPLPPLLTHMPATPPPPPPAGT